MSAFTPFPALAYITPAAEAVAAPRDGSPLRRRARSDSDLPAATQALATLTGTPLVAPFLLADDAGPFLAMPEPPASAPMLFPGEYATLPVPPVPFLADLSSWLVEPLPTGSSAGRTFDDLTPDELWRVGMQIGADVMVQSPTAHGFDLLHGDVPSPPSGPARHRQEMRCQRRADAAHPYRLPALCGDVDYYAPPLAGASTPFGHLIASGTPDHPLLGATGEGLTVDDGALRCCWYECPQRGHLFPTLVSLATHLARHVPTRRSLYPCLWTGCTRGVAHPFPKRHKLIAHLRSHTLERPFSCSVCGRAFAREDSRDTHLKVHSDERVGPWGCACHGGRVWKSWRGVRRHQATGTCTGVARISDVRAALASGSSLGEEEADEAAVAAQ